MSVHVSCPVDDAVCDACFQEFTDGTPILMNDNTHAETLRCTAPVPGTNPPSHCSGMTSDSSLGVACRKACAFVGGNFTSNAAACFAGAESYCSANAANMDCSCLQPSGKIWQTSSRSISYNDVSGYVAQNSTLDFDPRCMFPACNGALSASVIQDPTLYCPPVQITCSITGFRGDLDDVRANSINVIRQNCSGQGGAANTGHMSTPSAGPQLLLGMTTRQRTLLFVCVFVMITLLVLAWFLWRRAVAATNSTSDARGRRSCCTSRKARPR